METSIDEIAPNVFRLSAWVPDITADGFTFNQFLLTGEGLTPSLVPTPHQLAELEPTTSAVMYGSSFSGDDAAQLRGLGDEYAAMLA